ncbi:MAG: SpoIIE family protein phosphatase [Bacteroidetes bacterium]|nr:SpoIIE family protein phosphatase [Bacteroidota bacterium]
MNTRKNFIDIDHYQLNKNKNVVCGDVFLSKKIKEEGKIIAVLSDGLGSGIKANVLATMTASMALNFTSNNSPIQHTAEIISNTLPIDSERQISYATFTIIDIDYDSETKIINYDNPDFLLLRNQKFIPIPENSIEINILGKNKKMYSFDFKIQKEDRIIVFTDGVSQSGIGNTNMAFGWGIDNVKIFIIDLINKYKFISSHDLAKKIVNQANNNDILKPRDDISCAVLYFREPRKLLICTGPPFNKFDDNKLGSIIKKYNGKVIISGGTTSQIVSRLFNKEIHVGLTLDHSGLPPIAKMEGIELVTEGILTLGKVSEILQNINTTEVNGEGAAVEIIKNIFNNDIIEFVVGTKINNAHQDPNLPVELEIRRNVVKKIIKILEEKFLKEINLHFI